MRLNFFLVSLILTSLFDGIILKCIPKRTFNIDELKFHFLDGKYRNITFWNINILYIIIIKAIKNDNKTEVALSVKNGANVIIDYDYYQDTPLIIGLFYEIIKIKINWFYLINSKWKWIHWYSKFIN